MAIGHSKPWRSTGLTPSVIGRLARLKRIGLTRKKDLRVEQQRQAFLKVFQNYTVNQMVDVDAAGVDDTEDYPYGWCHKSKRVYNLQLGHCTRRISMIAG